MKNENDHIKKPGDYNKDMRYEHLVQWVIAAGYHKKNMAQ